MVPAIRGQLLVSTVPQALVLVWVFSMPLQADHVPQEPASVLAQAPPQPSVCPQRGAPQLGVQVGGGGGSGSHELQTPLGFVPHGQFTGPTSLQRLPLIGNCPGGHWNSSQLLLQALQYLNLIQSP